MISAEMSGKTRAATRARGWTKRWALPAHHRRVGDPLLESVLAARGIANRDRFLEPTLHHLHDPSLMPGLDRAAERILACVRDDQRLAIFGDYDVDGVTATAILVHTLRAIAPDWARDKLTTYIPHRIDEGYGLNEDAIGSLAEEGCTLIVTVDCGITATEPARTARELGLDLIITDHHNADETLPDAYALVHPGLPGSEYPYDGLCGAGVAYKLAWRLAALEADGDRASPEMRSLLVELLAFASLGTIADVVPLVDENRAIAKFGLVRVRHTPFTGLRALVVASGLDGAKIGEEDVGFKLAPRLNAVGRLGHARDALELFTTDDPAKAAAIARNLTRVNEERRATEKSIFEQACEMAQTAGMTAPDRRAIVLAGDWHPGVIGIVASRLVERFGRPTILLAREGDTLRGSGRSLDGYNLHGALADCAHCLTRFGGHDAAAGLALESARLDDFTEALIHHANNRLAPEDLAPLLDIDLISQTHELTPQAVGALDALKPFGRGNPPVRILLENARLATSPETFGREGAHLALRLAGQDGAQTVRAIAWRWGERRSDLLAGQRIDAVVRPEISDYSGRVEPVIEDLRPTE